jgi:branched-chain amino acid transport system ATP-binding protein
MTLLRLNSVSRRFGGVVAVDSVGFSIESGEIVGLMGANGAGKTTLFSLIAGNLRPTAGEILLDDRRIDRLRPDQISGLGVARTFQIVRPFAGLTVLENVAIGALFGSSREKSVTRANADARAVLEEVGLADRAEDYANALNLSGRKRLEIARALATNPKLLMLDEVMAGLTPREGADAVAMIRRLHKARNLTVIVVEHVMGILMDLCPRIVVLHHGALIAEGPPSEVANDQRVIDSYLGTRQESQA